MATPIGLQNQVVAGLDTFTYTVVTAGAYSVDCQSSIQPGSAVEIVIKQGSTTIVDNGGAASNPSPTQQSIGASARLSCAAADVISVIISSSAAIDNLPNSVKSNINIFQTI